MRILLIAGHGANDPGACSSFGIEREETRRVVTELEKQFKNYNDVVADVYPIGRNAYADVNNGNVQVNFADYDYVFEVHFNSASETAKGTEIWVTPMENSTVVEQKIVDKIAALGFINRGVKSEYFAVITSAKNNGVSSALLETCFISNREDMEKYNSKFNQICSAIVEGIAEGFELVRKTPVAVKENIKEVEKVDYIVQYSTPTDKIYAELLADRLKCPVINSLNPYAYYHMYKTVISVGLGTNKSGYTNVNLQGKDRYETLNLVLAYLKKLGK